MEMGDHSRIPLWSQFPLKIFSAQVLYIELYDKSRCVAALEVHLLVVEQSMDLLILAPYINDRSKLKHKL